MRTPLARHKHPVNGIVKVKENHTLHGSSNRISQPDTPVGHWRNQQGTASNEGRVDISVSLVTMLFRWAFLRCWWWIIRLLGDSWSRLLKWWWPRLRQRTSFRSWRKNRNFWDLWSCWTNRNFWDLWSCRTNCNFWDLWSCRANLRGRAKLRL